MAIVEFTIHVDEPDDVAVLFDRIQVWRSSAQNGVYSEITADSASVCAIDGTTAGPWNLNGKALSIILNDADTKVTLFSGVDPISVDDAISQINSMLPGLASRAVTFGHLHLESSIAGTQSVIDISGNAAAVLGLPIAHLNGKAARPLLSANTEDYPFVDFDSSSTNWYKTRYYSSVTGALSNFSPPIEGGVGPGLTSQTVIGSISLSDLTGAPVSNVRVVFVPTGIQVVADGSGNNFGVLPSVNRIEVLTNESGKATSTFVKGQRVKVFIEGTTFQREFVVPTTNFDVLSVASVEPDPLSIVTVPPFAIKVS